MSAKVLAATAFNLLSSQFKFSGKKAVLGNLYRNDCDEHKKRFSTTPYKFKEDLINVTVVDEKNQRVFTVSGPENKILQELISKEFTPDDGFAACAGCQSCGTCKVDLTPEDFERLKDQVESIEDDMLSTTMAGPTERLSCTLRLTPECNGMTVTLKPLRFTSDSENDDN